MSRPPAGGAVVVVIEGADCEAEMLETLAGVSSAVSSRDFGNAREPATRWRSGCCRVACAVFKAAASASIISFCAVRLCLRLRRPVCGLGGCCAVGVTGARSVWSRGATCGRLGVCRCCQEHPERSKNRITRDAEPEYFHFSAPLPAAELVGTYGASNSI